MHGDLNLNGTVRRDVILNIESSWHNICLIGLFCIFMGITIFGNTLVIIAVITTRRLRTITNCFVMSLSLADLLVGIFVMPPAIAVHITGSWRLGGTLCDVWISLDILLCTASILSLCAISVDRYLAITQPLNYSRKRRSKNLAFVMILVVWLLAVGITCPPFLGWYERGRHKLEECRYNQNGGYVLFSALGSFFFPMSVMVYVYAKIACVVASRHDKIIQISTHSNTKELNKRTSLGPKCKSEFDLVVFSHLTRANYKPHSITYKLQTKAVTEMNSNEFDQPDKSTSNTIFDITQMSMQGERCMLTNSQSSSSMKPKFGLKTVSSSTHSSKITESDIAAVQPKMQCGGNISYHPKNFSHRLISFKREKKTTHTLSIVVGGFIVCWLPFFTYYLFTPFFKKQHVSRTLTEILTWLGWFNSGINPFIYAFYSHDFRTAFCRILQKIFCCITSNSPGTQYSTNISLR